MPFIRSQHALLIIGIASLVLLTNLGGAKLWDRDEPRNAGCAREMLERSDWVVPWFNDEIRTHKPVLLYWLMMASYSTLGVSEFSARLPSALLAIGTVWLTWWIARRQFNPKVALWSGIILSTFVMFPVVARAATPDSTLIFFTTAAIVAFAYFQSAANCTTGSSFQFPGFRQSLIIYAMMGLAVLAKGPVGLVLPTAVIGLFCLFKRLPSAKIDEREKREHLKKRHRLLRMMAAFHPRHFLETCWAMRPLTAIAIALLIAGPWYAWVGWRTNGFWLIEFFGEHNFGRATRSMEGHGGSPLIYYPVAILVCCFPWSVFTIPTILTTNSTINHRTDDIHEGQRDLTILMTCWIAVYVGIFSVAKTKLPSYIAPCYPAIAILLATYVAQVAGDLPKRVPTRWWTAGLSIGSLGGVAMIVGLAIALRDAFPNEPVAIWLAAIGSIPAIGGAVGLWRRFQRDFRFSAFAYGVAAIAFAVALHGFATQAISERQEYANLLPKAPLADTGNMELACFDRLEPTWVFYSGSPVKHFAKDATSEALSFLAQSADARMIVPRSALSDPHLSAGCVVVDECKYFLRKDQLCLVKAADSFAANQDTERTAEWTARKTEDPLE